MKKTTLLLVLAIIPFLGFCQLTNTTFDTDVSGWVTQNAAGFSFNADDADASASSGSVQIVAAAATNSGIKSSPNAPLPTAGNYKLKFKVKGTAGDKIQGVIFQSSTGGQANGDNYTIQATGVWEPYETTFTNAFDLSNLNVRIIGKTASATYLVDNIELVQTFTQDSWVSNPDFEDTVGGISDWSEDASTGRVTSTFSNNASTGIQSGRLDFVVAQTANTENDFLENVVYDFAETLSPTEVDVTFDVEGTAGLEIQVKIETYDASDVLVENLNTGFNTLDAVVGFEPMVFNKPVTLPFNKIKLFLKVRGASMAQIGDFVEFDNVLGSFQYEVLSTPSFDVFSDNKIKLFPNPAKDVVNFSNIKNLQSVTVFDITGKKVLESKKISNNQLNISALKTGVYLVNVVSDNILTTKKLIVK
jgi:hypothetical protein